MKKLCSLILSLLLLLSLFTACGQADSGHVKYEKVIGACLSQTTVTPFGAYLRQTLEQQCEAHNWKLICLDAERDLAKQQTQTEAMLQMSIDLFLYWPVERSAGLSTCKKFHEAGIPVVVVNGDVAEEAYPYTAAFVGPDQYQMAYDIGSYLTESTPEGGNVFMINGGVASTQFMLRQQGFEDALRGSGLSLIRVEYSESDRARAQSIMENYLSAYDDIDIVFCASDNLAIGAINAIDASRRTGIRVVSIDGMEEAFQYIRSGKMELTVLQTPGATSARFADVAERIFAGNFPENRFCFSEYTLIDSNNIDDYEAAY